MSIESWCDADGTRSILVLVNEVKRGCEPCALVVVIELVDDASNERSLGGIEVPRRSDDQVRNYKIRRDCRQHGDGLHRAVQAVAHMHNLALAS
ncbi:hypothetical protein QF035_000815 [Streptomyces umbrinus]|uniref:Transposase n=1 Tax=Streptomyces umbrinus TaxID=67370 RepID=A0ABU0SI36_9ACTN|nr:hypothetical protein [Streptomyces umbrinus]